MGLGLRHEAVGLPLEQRSEQDYYSVVRADWEEKGDGEEKGDAAQKGNNELRPLLFAGEQSKSLVL